MTSKSNWMPASFPGFPTSNLWSLTGRKYGGGRPGGTSHVQWYHVDRTRVDTLRVVPSPCLCQLRWSSVWQWYTWQRWCPCINVLLLPIHMNSIIKLELHCISATEQNTQTHAGISSLGYQTPSTCVTHSFSFLFSWISSCSKQSVPPARSAPQPVSLHPLLQQWCSRLWTLKGNGRT